MKSKFLFYSFFIAGISTGYAQNAQQDYFVTTWNTEAGVGQTGNTIIMLPITVGAYDVDINNDGDFDDMNETNNTGPITIDFATLGGVGTKIIAVRPNAGNTAGELRIDHNATGSTPQKLTSINKWGTIVWTSMETAFLNCSNMTIANDAGVPNLTMVTSTHAMFSSAANFNSDISDWNVSQVTDMSVMFSRAISFTSDLSNWNVSSVSDMTNMFKNTSSFTSEHYEALIIGWSRLSTLQSDVTFKAPPANYCRNVQAERDMLVNTYNWTITGDYCPYVYTVDTRLGVNGENRNKVFINVLGGVYDIDFGNDGNYEYENHTALLYFDKSPEVYTIAIRPNDANNPNHQLSMRPYDSIGDGEKLISIDQWGSISWASFGSIFQNCPNLATIPAGAPNLTRVSNMNNVFRNASSLTGDLSSWDVSNATSMVGTFSGATNFNSDLSSWNVSSVTNMKEMFKAASNFTSNLGSWDVFKVTDMTDMFRNTSSFTNEHYEALLTGWSNLTLESNVAFRAPPVDYCRYGKAEREMIVNTYNWTITGDYCPFVYTVDTRLAVDGANDTRILANISDGRYDVDVGNDGSYERKNYIGLWYLIKSPGIYTIAIRPNDANNPNHQLSVSPYDRDGDGEKLIRIDQWGSISWASFGSTFQNCPNLATIPAEAPNLTRVYNMNNMFRNAGSLTGDLSSWDVSNATSMVSTFSGATSFTSDLSTWDISNVTDMEAIFNEAVSFSSDLSSWNVSSVTNMTAMFNGVAKFNSDLNSWNVSQVTNMTAMFDGVVSFNSELSNWNVSNVIDMDSMFSGAASFNSDLSNWNVSNVIDMDSMFSGAASFNSDLSNWNVSNVIDMDSMFSGAASFNSDLSNWNVSNVIDMDSMFSGAVNFTTENYDALLVGWSSLTALQSGVTFGAPPVIYCDGEAGRTILTSTYHWNIDGDEGLNCPFIITFDPVLGQASGNKSVYIPVSGGSYDIDTNGDGIYDDLNNTSARNMVLQPGSGNTFRIRPNPAHNVDNQLSIDSNSLSSLNFSSTLKSVDKWGSVVWTSMENAFRDCPNMIIADDAGVPNLTMVTNMVNMFRNANSFNSDISSWDVSNVTDMANMFRNANSFNSDISSWDVSNVTDMTNMFRNATSFNSDISAWDVSNVTDMTDMFTIIVGSPNPISFTDYNYEKLLSGWSKLTLQNNVDFGAPPASYCAGKTGRDVLTSAPHNWRITGDMESCSNLAISINTFLQGSYDTTTSIMGDDLRVAGIIPTTSPYGGVATIEDIVLNVTGDDAIVDWVEVSLHDPNNVSIVISSTSALLQRDGGVVALDGSSALQIDGIAGNYKVSINHRNHIPVITDAAQSLSTTETAIDFTNDLTIVTGGSNAMAEVATGIYALFSGDVNGNNQVQVDDYNAAIQHVGRGGYLTSDVDMNGELQVSDINFVLKTLGKGAQF